ncbi:MAG: hypothetical protein K2X64_06155 [Rhodocyclaceae bacterium]|nr:hypothetical protein [Rhodocyclaceae bacterium]
MYELIATADGSLTLKDEETGELYHNKAGAYQEALVNYALPSGALKRLAQKGEIILLDVCYGLGYNSLVLIQEAINSSAKGKIKIIGIEKNPLLLSLADNILSFKNFSPLAELIDLARLENQQEIQFSCNGLDVQLSVMLDSVKSILAKFTQEADFVFHDPFSPKRVPELWTVDIFRRYFALLQPRKGAVLTYSAASAVRGGLAEAGFTLRKTSALGAKTGGTLALVDPSAPNFISEDLPIDDQQKLASSSGIPYRDKDFTLDRPEILRLRQTEQSQSPRLKAGS